MENWYIYDCFFFNYYASACATGDCGKSYKLGASGNLGQFGYFGMIWTYVEGLEGLDICYSLLRINAFWKILFL